MIIFNLHGQYAYQMKAKINLTSYWLSKSDLVYENFFERIGFFFLQFLLGKKFWITNSSKKKNPNESQILFLKMILNTKDGNYMIQLPSK